MSTATDLYLPFLTRVLTPARLRHTLGVAQVTVELSAVYGAECGLNRDLAETAGLLHDAAKDLDEAAIEQIVREEAIPMPAPEDGDYVHYLHGPVGAAYIRRELGITDPRVLDAVAMHTYAGQGPGLTAPLTWLVRFADLLEPNRDWSRVPWLVEGLPRLRVLAYGGELEAAARLQTGLLIDWFSATGHPVHPNMRVLYQELG